jgi:integrase
VWNAFCSWLHTYGHLTDPLRVKLLRFESRVLATFTPAEQQRLVQVKPRSWMDRRAHVLALTLLDTGPRIEEALALRRSQCDFDNLLLTVYGKGRKERRVPMSIELRVLFRWLSPTHRAKKLPESEWVFTTRHPRPSWWRVVACVASFNRVR